MPNTIFNRMHDLYLFLHHVQSKRCSFLATEDPFCLTSLARAAFPAAPLPAPPSLTPCRSAASRRRCSRCASTSLTLSRLRCASASLVPPCLHLARPAAPPVPRLCHPQAPRLHLDHIATPTPRLRLPRAAMPPPRSRHGSSASRRCCSRCASTRSRRHACAAPPPPSHRSSVSRRRCSRCASTSLTTSRLCRASTSRAAVACAALRLRLPRSAMPPPHSHRCARAAALPPSGRRASTSVASPRLRLPRAATPPPRSHCLRAPPRRTGRCRLRAPPRRTGCRHL
jgi:hypothetical protein